jgi:hypothetical protein
MQKTEEDETLEMFEEYLSLLLEQVDNSSNKEILNKRIESVRNHIKMINQIKKLN